MGDRNNISKDLSQIIHDSAQLAATLQQDILTVEHLFYTLLTNSVGNKILSLSGADIGCLTEMILNYLKMKIPSSKNAFKDANPMQTPALLRVFANMFNQDDPRKQIGVGDFLLSMLGEESSYATRLLISQGVQTLDIIKSIISISEPNPISIVDSIKLPNIPKMPDFTGWENTESEARAPKKDKLFLDKFAKNLNSLAKKNQIDPLIGRDEELELITQILCRRKKNNPILLGEPGVGKSAVVEGLALRIVKKQVPPAIKDSIIYSLDINSVIAGTKYRGEFEDRMQKILDELGQIKNAIIFIDEIHMIVGAGQSQGGSMDFSNILKPYLSSGNLKCVGATTYSEYKNSLDKNKALARRFTQVQIKEPSQQECFLILKKIAPIYEKFHNIKYSEDAIKSCISLSSKYVVERHLPDKAIDILDEIGAKIHLKRKLEDNKQYLVKKSDIEELLAKVINIPKSVISSNEGAKLKNLESNLKKRIFSQDEAISKIVEKIKINKAGLGELNHPIASFLFSGPSGVGKTELSKELAKELGIHFARIDMSEFMESHSISKLIGSPAGYVGYEEGSLLVDTIRANPHCVLLLDEIEKAHTDIYNVLLQVMDNAALSDNKGNKADFKNVFLILTTNAGSKEGNSMGFLGDNSQRSQNAIRDIFSPEFRSRLDAIINFNPLGIKDLVKIANKYIKDINDSLKEKNVSLTLHKSAGLLIANTSVEKALGAREIKKIIDSKIKLPLSQEILFGKLKSGGKAKIISKDGELLLETL